MTYGELIEPVGGDRVREFHERAPGVFEVAADTPGHLATASTIGWVRGERIDRQDWGDWAPYRVPSYYPGTLENGQRSSAQTLSLWADLANVYGFAYSGRHMEALRKRKAWFKPRVGPTYVAWWVDDDHIPSWDEACGRIEYLHEHGATPHAFDFRTAFDEVGEAVKLG
jgi:hypothetical protein